jgi:hypothetical protein
MQKREAGFLLLMMIEYFLQIFRDSSAVEQEAVNFKVLGSNPSRGALEFSLKRSFFVASIWK